MTFEYVTVPSAIETPVQEEEVYICANCGAEFDDENDLTMFDDDMLCEDCLDEQTCVCDHCGEREYQEHVSIVGDDVLCENCTDAHTNTCSNCGDREYSENITWVDGDPICDSCCDYSSEISRCNRCGDLHYTENMEYDDSDDEYYCSDCFDGSIYSYHAGPALTFYGTGAYHYGVELEVDGGDSDDRRDSARRVTSTLYDRVYCSSDSSLETGFEIITHPHTYDELILLPWETAFRELIDSGWRGHDVSTSGLHVHIGRACFDSDDSIARFCTFFENNWNFVHAFSRRSKSAMNQYAARYFSDEDELPQKYTTKQVKDQTEMGRDRYRAVNLTNYSTVEVRVFRSTLNYNTFMATLELVHLLATRCNGITDLEAESMSVSEWLRDASENLAAYCKKRGYPLQRACDDSIREVA